MTVSRIRDDPLAVDDATTRSQQASPTGSALRGTRRGAGPCDGRKRPVAGILVAAASACRK